MERGAVSYVGSFPVESIPGLGKALSGGSFPRLVQALLKITSFT